MCEVGKDINHYLGKLENFNLEEDCQITQIVPNKVMP